MSITRRGFLGSAAVASLAAGLNASEAGAQEALKNGGVNTGKRPIIVSANNGFKYLDDAFAFLKGGGDTLDAALRVVKGPEDDPHDDTVGLGGIPNEEGVVELDACCMHGPSRRAGSVGGVRNIKNVSLVAKAVMEHTAPRHAGGRRRGTVCRSDGVSARKSAYGKFAQNLVAVEGIPFDGRLVGTGNRRSAMEGATIPAT